MMLARLGETIKVSFTGVATFLEACSRPVTNVKAFKSNFVLDLK